MSQVGSAFKRIGGTVSRAISNVPVIGPTVSSIGSAAFGVVAGGIDALTGGIFGLTPQQKLPDLSLNFSSFGSTAQGRLVAVKQAIMTRQVIYGTRFGSQDLGFPKLLSIRVLMP